MYSMSFMGVTYPLIIGLIGIIYMWVVFILGRRKMYKSVIGAVILAIAFTVYAPIKIDGTNTKANNTRTVKERTVEYNEVQETSKIIITSKPTFQERLDQETLRSEKANQKIKKDILLEGNINE